MVGLVWGNGCMCCGVGVWMADVWGVGCGGAGELVFGEVSMEVAWVWTRVSVR